MPGPEGPATSRLPEVTLRRIGSADTEILRRFFETLSADADAMARFHPHPFTAEHAVTIAQYNGRDYYAAMLTGDGMVAYGMLRGWDEGYEIPSLGIIVSGVYRGLGFGRVMMDHLHAVARARGAMTIRLKVYKTNTAAAHLYRRMGYVLSDLNEREWSGTFDMQAIT